jgi:hypothetical protein
MGSLNLPTRVHEDPFVFVCLSCLFAAPSFAVAPVAYVPDNSATVTRRSSGDPHGATNSVVCVGPAKPGSPYIPGKISVTLQRAEPDAFAVDVFTYTLHDGRTCFDIYVTSDALGRYTVFIRSTAETMPHPIFFHGLLAAIPEVHY